MIESALVSVARNYKRNCMLWNGSAAHADRRQSQIRGRKNLSTSRHGGLTLSWREGAEHVSVRPDADRLLFKQSPSPAISLIAIDSAVEESGTTRAARPGAQIFASAAALCRLRCDDQCRCQSSVIVVTAVCRAVAFDSLCIACVCV